MKMQTNEQIECKVKQTKIRGKKQSFMHSNQATTNWANKAKKKQRLNKNRQETKQERRREERKKKRLRRDKVERRMEIKLKTRSVIIFYIRFFFFFRERKCKPIGRAWQKEKERENAVQQRNGNKNDQSFVLSIANASRRVYIKRVVLFVASHTLRLHLTDREKRKDAKKPYRLHEIKTNGEKMEIFSWNAAFLSFTLVLLSFSIGWIDRMQLIHDRIRNIVDAKVEVEWSKVKGIENAIWCDQSSNNLRWRIHLLNGDIEVTDISSTCTDDDNDQNIFVICHRSVRQRSALHCATSTTFVSLSIFFFFCFFLILFLCASFQCYAGLNLNIFVVGKNNKQEKHHMCATET